MSPYRRSFDENKPCGRIIKIPITLSKVRTLAIEPVMKNSSVDCACEIVNADAIVPSRLDVPPPEVKKLFKKIANEQLVDLGYEKDESW